MSLDDYKVVLYRNQPEGWVAEIPAISGCYALMPTRQQALEELNGVFQMISEEYREKGLALPADTTEIVHSWRYGARIPECRTKAWIRSNPPGGEPRTVESFGRSCRYDSVSWRPRDWPSAVFQAPPAAWNLAR